MGHAWTIPRRQLLANRVVIKRGKGIPAIPRPFVRRWGDRNEAPCAAFEDDAAVFVDGDIPAADATPDP